MHEEPDWDGLRKSLGNRRVIPSTPEGRGMSGRDGGIIGRSGGSPGPASGAAFWIHYVDRDGEPSERVITVRNLTGHYGQIECIFAFCHLRQAYREFRFDGIAEMVCHATGEVLDPHEHCRELALSGAIKAKDKPLTALMNLLAFMARCDGHYHELEQREMETILTRYALRFGGDDRTLEQSLIECPRLAPGSGDVMKTLRSFRRFPGGPRFSRFAIECCADIIDADGRHAPEEVLWAVEVSNVLKRIAMRADGNSAGGWENGNG